MKVVFLLFSLSFSIAPSHDAAIAMFRIFEEGDGTKLFVSIDVKNLSQEIDVQPSDINTETLNVFLKHNLSIYANAKLVTYEVNSFVLQQDHLKIEASFKDVPLIINTIKIDNTCLLGIDDHINIIQIDVEKKSFDFRMDKKRTEISVEY